MSDPVYAPGSTVANGAETLLRQVVLERLTVLASDEALQRQLFARQDTLEQGSQDAWVDECVSWFRDISHRLTVIPGYPVEQVQLPCVSIVLQSASEDASSAVCGDVWDRQSELIGILNQSTPTSSAVYDHIEYGMAVQASVQIGSWATGPEETQALHTITRWSLHSGKDRMIRLGLRDITFAESGFEPTGNPLYPRPMFVPLVTAQLTHWYRYRERTGPQKHRLSVLPCTFTLP